MEMNTGKKKIKGADICMVTGVIMVLCGVYWMWFRPQDSSNTTTACCCFCAAAVLFSNRARKKK